MSLEPPEPLRLERIYYLNLGWFSVWSKLGLGWFSLHLWNFGWVQFITPWIVVDFGSSWSLVLNFTGVRGSKVRYIFWNFSTCADEISRKPKCHPDILNGTRQWFDQFFNSHQNSLDENAHEIVRICTAHIVRIRARRVKKKKILWIVQICTICGAFSSNKFLEPVKI